MNVVVTCPSLAPHGGTRVIVEIANGLCRMGHYVHLLVLGGLSGKSSWRFHPSLRVTPRIYQNRPFDAVLITSPHGMHLANGSFRNVRDKPARVFLHLQMLEDRFRPQNPAWVGKCLHMYRHPAPMFAISRWNIRELEETHGRRGETIHVGNGVNLVDFPLERGERRSREPLVLVEGWEAYNPTKDVDRVAPRVAARLREDGARVVAYGGVPLRTDPECLDDYFLRPSLAKLNELYATATILLKASRYDARSCSPVEAMTKMTPCARAIVEGDDDLVDDENCLRTAYDPDELLVAARRLLGDHVLRHRLGEAGHEHLKANGWDHWIRRISARMEAG